MDRMDAKSFHECDSELEALLHAGLWPHRPSLIYGDAHEMAIGGQPRTG